MSAFKKNQEGIAETGTNGVLTKVQALSKFMVIISPF
jgi:hypothetical protein